MSARKPYVPQLSRTSWFLESARYKTYMLHEVSSFFVAIYCVIVIAGLFAVANGPDAWQGWIDFVKSPFGVVFHMLAFAFAIIHTTSWFKAVPQAMRIMRGEEVLPGKILVGGHYVVLGVVSLFFLGLAALG